MEQQPTSHDPAIAPLEATDPDFWAFYSAFAFEQTRAHSSLPDADRLVCQLAALVAVGARSEFEVMLPLALDADVTPVQVKELVYQAVAYVGMGRVVDFLFLVNAELERRGIALPLDSQSTTTPATRAERGLATQKAIVGADRVDAMRASAPADARHFQEFLETNCFGDYYTRGGFDLRQRELITFALLVALGGADPQVGGHVAANLNVGNTRQHLLDVLTVLVPYIGYPRTLNGLAQVNTHAPVEVRPPAEE